MQAALTKQQARQVTGGRTPLVPIEYETALKALEACVTLDETKYWSDKADALAAWAKIYRSDDMARKANLLKLHAHRRMGVLAEELRPTHNGPPKGSNRGSPPGAFSLLLDAGLSPSASKSALNIGRATEDEFSAVVQAGYAISSAAKLFRGRGVRGSPTLSSEAYEWLSQMQVGPELPSVLAALHTRSPSGIAEKIGAGEITKARVIAIQIIEWLDEFEQHLPRENQKMDRRQGVRP